jgi:hypothetical protein
MYYYDDVSDRYPPVDDVVEGLMTRNVGDILSLAAGCTIRTDSSYSGITDDSSFIVIGHLSLQGKVQFWLYSLSCTPEHG